MIMGGYILAKRCDDGGTRIEVKRMVPMMKQKDRHSKDEDYITEFEYEEPKRDPEYTDFEDTYDVDEDYEYSGGC